MLCRIRLSSIVTVVAAWKSEGLVAWRPLLSVEESSRTSRLLEGESQRSARIQWLILYDHFRQRTLGEKKRGARWLVK